MEGYEYRGHLKEPGVYFRTQLHKSGVKSLQLLFEKMLINGKGT